MAVHKTIKQSDLQKKLKALEYQLYGKNEKNAKLDVRNSKMDDQTSIFQPLNLSSNLQHPTSSSDLIYLKQDLTKIALLASLAIGVQIILYYSQFLNQIKLL